MGTSSTPMGRRSWNTHRLFHGLRAGQDIKVLGLLFVISGGIDLMWILAYPEYSLRVFGTTFSGWAGEAVKFQHPLIHWLIGYGLWHTRQWAFWSYLGYLTLACLSEVINQLALGFHQTRTTMIVVSLLFGTYIIARQQVFIPNSSKTRARLEE
ncbi:MAG: hypothetical protein O2999_09150 [Nitrospirae bacterium]|nr:hypothetical protein [Nitrospirota bacterium]